jgi:hypothetical protein
MPDGGAMATTGEPHQTAAGQPHHRPRPANHHGPQATRRTGHGGIEHGERNFQVQLLQRRHWYPISTRP